MTHTSKPPFAQALLCTSMTLTLSACMAPLNSHQASVSFPSSSPYIGAHYGPDISRYGAEQILYAQDNRAPQILRGASEVQDQAPYVYAQERYYADYQNAPSSVQAGFEHHLGDGEYQVIKQEEQTSKATYAMPQTYVSQSYVSEELVPEGYVAGSYAPEGYEAQSHASESYVSGRGYAAPQNHEAHISSGRVETAPMAQTINASEQSLRQSLGAAVQHSPLLAIEDLKIQEAQEVLTQAKAQGRFKLNLEGVAGPSASETVFSVVDRTDSSLRIRRGANLDLSLPLYQGGRIKAQKKVAEVGIQEAEANFDVVETSVAQEAALAHFNVIRDRRLIKIYERNVALLTSQKTTVAALLAAGENTLTDQALIDARLASIKVSLEQAYASLAASESTYKKLVGRSAPDLIPAQTISLPESLAEIKEAAQKNNPQIRAVQTRAEAAFHNVEVAKSFGRPRLALQGVLRAAEGQSDTIRRNSAAELLLNLSVPLLSGGENKSRVRQAALAQSRAELENRSFQDNLNERIEQLWANVQSARRSQAPNRAQIAAAQKAYEAISQQRDAGVATSLDVQSVEQTLLDAQLNLVQAQNTEDVSRFQLLSLMGAL